MINEVDEKTLDHIYGEKIGFEKGVIGTLIFLSEHFEKKNCKWGKKAADDCHKFLDIYCEE